MNRKAGLFSDLAILLIVLAVTVIILIKAYQGDAYDLSTKEIESIGEAYTEYSSARLYLYLHYNKIVSELNLGKYKDQFGETPCDHLYKDELGQIDNCLGQHLLKIQTFLERQPIIYSDTEFLRNKVAINIRMDKNTMEIHSLVPMISELKTTFKDEDGDDRTIKGGDRFDTIEIELPLSEEFKSYLEDLIGLPDFFEQERQCVVDPQRHNGDVCKTTPNLVPSTTTVNGEVITTTIMTITHEQTGLTGQYTLRGAYQLPSDPPTT